MSFTFSLSWCTLLVSGMFWVSFLELGRNSFMQKRRGRERDPGREHCQVLAPTWTKKAKRTGPEHGNIVPESLLLPGPQNILVLICIVSEVPQRRLLQCWMNEQMNESTYPSTHPLWTNTMYPAVCTEYKDAKCHPCSWRMYSQWEKAVMGRICSVPCG